MKQKDDSKYTFVVSQSNRNLIRVRRYEISKRLAHSCLGIALLAIGFGSFGLLNGKFPPQIAQAHASLLGKKSIKHQTGEGGPDITEAPAPRNEFDEKIRKLQQSFRDSEYTPSIYPLIGKINNEFGWRRNPFGGYSTEHHPGMDIDGERGDTIIAPAKGIVIKSGWQGGYGNMIEIEHGNGLTTRYGHLSQIDVEPGQEIIRGQELGKVGSTGRSTGPHLHYEVRIDDEAIDPRPYLPQNASPAVQPQ